MIKRLFAFLAAAALAGCAQPLPPDPGPPDRADDGRAWIYNADGPEPRLAHGTPQSDDVVVMMSCRARSGSIEVMQGALRPGQGIALSSGGRSVVLTGRSEPDQLSGGVFVTASRAIGDPVLQSFRRTGSLAVMENGRWAPLAASPSERGGIAAFFAACGG